MARPSLRRAFAVFWDRDAARQMQVDADRTFKEVAARGSEEFEQGMKKGGREAGRTLTRALQQEYNLRMARARLQLAEGVIDEKAFEREGREAAVAFNRGLTGGIRRLRGQGNVSDLQLAALTGRFRREPGAPGRAGVFGGMALGGLAGPLAGIISVSAAMSGARSAIEASDRYDASLRKLEGTAKLTGQSFETLSAAAARTRDEFELSQPVATDLTAVATRLVAKTGDLSQAQQFLTRWMDLAAAAGLDAQQAMEQLEITFRGQDEGLNRLGLANPAEIYKKWGAGADEASKAQAIVNEVLREGSRAAGSYSEFLQDNAGRAQIAANEHERLAAEMGDSIQPMREAGNELKTGLLAALNELLQITAKPIEITIKFLSEGTGALARYLRWSAELEARMNRFYARIGLHPGPDMTSEVVVGDISTAGLPGAPTGDNAALALARQNAAPIPRPPAPIDQKAVDRIKAMWAWADPELGVVQERLGGMPTLEDLRRAAREQFTEFGGTLETIAGGMEEQRRKLLDDAVRDMEERFQRIQNIANEAAYQMSAAFQDAFRLMMEEGATLGNFLEGIARGIAGAMLAGLAQFAQGKVAENIAAAIEATAYALGFVSHGNFASASAAWASAAEHTAASVAWAALAGGAGAGRAGVTGGAGGIPPSTRDAGLDTARGIEMTPAPIIIEVDPFDPANPVHAKGVGEAVRLDVRLGGRNIYSVGALP